MRNATQAAAVRLHDDKTTYTGQVFGLGITLLQAMWLIAYVHSCWLTSSISSNGVWPAEAHLHCSKATVFMQCLLQRSCCGCQRLMLSR